MRNRARVRNHMRKSQTNNDEYTHTKRKIDKEKDMYLQKKGAKLEPIYIYLYCTQGRVEYVNEKN